MESTLMRSPWTWGGAALAVAIAAAVAFYGLGWFGGEDDAIGAPAVEQAQ